MSYTNQIEQIQAVPYRLPMHGALRWGKHSTLSEIHHVLVKVSLRDGSEGIAEAPPRPTIYGETVHSIIGIIQQELAPRIIGLSAHNLGEIQMRLHEVRNNHTAKGAVDVAIHDALAQHNHCTLAEHLGAKTERIKVSYILGIGERDTVLAEAERVFTQGIRVLKVKVGRDWDEDLATIVELQTTFGSALSLYADANECLQIEDASRKLSQLSEMGLLYCEEPLPIELIQERAALRSGEHLPLIADDSAFTLRDLNRELSLNTFDILNIKTARTGYTESAEMLNRAQQAGKGVMIGSQASTGLGTARAALFAAKQGIDHPSELSFFLKLQEDIVTHPVPIINGYITTHDAQSIQIDAERLREATLK